MEKINAVGLVCPMPVIQTKRALKQADAVETTVDNEIATQNLRKMAEQMKYNYTCEKVDENRYVVVISKNGTENVNVEPESQKLVQATNAYTVVIDTDIMGRGNDELGATLLNGFVESLAEQDELPEKIIMYNGGVKLALKDAPTADALNAMRDAGVKVYCCGACVNFYEVSDKIIDVEITNMYEIVNMMRQSLRVVKP
jgi:selenium metabolism protein YedF